MFRHYQGGGFPLSAVQLLTITLSAVTALMALLVWLNWERLTEVIAVCFCRILLALSPIALLAFGALFLLGCLRCRMHRHFWW